jgi:hypothetical protein
MCVVKEILVDLIDRVFGKYSALGRQPRDHFHEAVGKVTLRIVEDLADGRHCDLPYVEEAGDVTIFARPVARQRSISVVVTHFVVGDWDPDGGECLDQVAFSFRHTIASANALILFGKISFGKNFGPNIPDFETISNQMILESIKADGNCVDIRAIKVNTSILPIEPFTLTIDRGQYLLSGALQTGFMPPGTAARIIARKQGQWAFENCVSSHHRTHASNVNTCVRHAGSSTRRRMLEVGRSSSVYVGTAMVRGDASPMNHSGGFTIERSGVCFGGKLSLTANRRLQIAEMVQSPISSYCAPKLFAER